MSKQSDNNINQINNTRRLTVESDKSNKLASRFKNQNSINNDFKAAIFNSKKKQIEYYIARDDLKTYQKDKTFYGKDFILKTWGFTEKYDCPLIQTSIEQWVDEYEEKQYQILIKSEKYNKYHNINPKNAHNSAICKIFREAVTSEKNTEQLKQEANLIIKGIIKYHPDAVNLHICNNNDELYEYLNEHFLPDQAASGNLVMVELIYDLYVESKRDEASFDKIKQSALIEALLANHKPVVNWLLKKNLDKYPAMIQEARTYLEQQQLEQIDLAARKGYERGLTLLNLVEKSLGLNSNKDEEKTFESKVITEKTRILSNYASL